MARKSKLLACASIALPVIAVPLTMILSSGQHFDIEHPGNASGGVGFLIVFMILAIVASAVMAIIAIVLGARSLKLSVGAGDRSNAILGIVLSSMVCTFYALILLPFGWLLL